MALNQIKYVCILFKDIMPRFCVRLALIFFLSNYYYFYYLLINYYYFKRNDKVCHALSKLIP